MEKPSDQGLGEEACAACAWGDRCRRKPDRPATPGLRCLDWVDARLIGLILEGGDAGGQRPNA